MTTDFLTWKELRDIKCSELEEAANAWHRVSSRSAADRETVRRAMSAKLIETQESESAQKAVLRLGRLIQNFDYVATECGLVRTALNGLSADLAGPQRQLRLALDEAAALAFTVNADGSISYPSAVVGSGEGEKRVPGGIAQGSSRGPVEPPGAGEYGKPPQIVPYDPHGDRPRFDLQVNPHARAAQDIADRIARAVRSAAAVDARYAKTLNGLRAPKGMDVTEATLADMRRDVADVRTSAGGYLAAAMPEGASPAEYRRWWEGLDEEQRREYVDIAPQLIGMSDGIPAAARDEANRSYLPVLIEELERSGSDPAMLDGLRKIEERLLQPSKVPMYLLGISDEGNGRAIISFGNPDTSRNVSAYVPGLGTKLDGEFGGGTVKRALDTAVGAQRYDKSTASIVWLGYDAPRLVDVVTAGHAERGAPAYNRFMSGLVATNEHDDPHVTAIGHSYGSLTVGTAAKQSGGIPGVDDIVLVGSPGVGVERAADLGVPPERVYVGAADNDIVTKLPRFPEVLVSIAGEGVGVSVPESFYDSDDNYYGKDPASREFGAQRFAVDDGPRPVRDANPVGAHSQYFTPETDRVSADNIARIVSGEYGIKTERHR
ncbi:alpha/beta hydrolase [Streptomyces sp. NPDC058953]|uniref:alpha/beta hydrolase n=1 Tax=unclassified Streptomyces TaxID=2593676 RepID=UPI0036AC1D8A